VMSLDEANDVMDLITAVQALEKMGEREARLIALEKKTACMRGKSLGGEEAPCDAAHRRRRTRAIGARRLAFRDVKSQTEYLRLGASPANLLYFIRIIRRRGMTDDGWTKNLVHPSSAVRPLLCVPRPLAIAMRRPPDRFCRPS